MFSFKNKIITVIDIGSITINIVIAKVTDNNDFIILYEEKKAARLGKTISTNGLLEEDSINIALQILREYKKISENYQSDILYIVATSAVRNAKNKEDFIKRAKEVTNCDINVIDGKKEAYLIAKAAIEATSNVNKNRLIIDIGGGSVEFIFVDNNNNIQWLKSFEIGVARQISIFSPQDPISYDDCEKITKFIDSNLQELYEFQNNKYKAQVMVGTSGAFESLTSILVHRKNLRFDVVDFKSFEISYEEFLEICELIIKSKRKDREKIPGLHPIRVDMIVVACILIRQVLEKTGIKDIIATSYSLKEGIVREIINNEIKIT